MRKSALFILLIALTATIVSAQFKIKIPKVNIPKVETSKSQTEQPVNPKDEAQSAGSSKAQATASAARPVNASGEILLLDSATYFALEEVRVSHKPAGWYLKPNFKLKGDIPNRSALRIQVKKNGKELSNLRCEIEEAAVFRCNDKTKVLNQLGMLDVEVNFVNGDTDTESLLRKYKIDVHKTNKFNDYNDYFVNRHPDVAVAYLSLEGKNPWIMKSRADNLKGSPNLFLNTVISRDHLEKYSGSPFLRCKVDGQAYKLKHGLVAFRQKDGSVFATYESKYLTGIKKGSNHKDYLKFALQQIQLPLSMGTETNHTNDVSKSPGDWECTIVAAADREIIRTFRFTVDASGRIVAHPEQQNGNVVFGDWEWMIDMDIPAGGSPMDHRLKRSPEMGFFHGISWSTPEGKAMAERVPNKGNPYPLPAK